MDKFLQGHVGLVTGGAQGIGWAITQALADAGAQVYACTYSESSLARAAQELAGLPWAERIHLAQCDVAERALLEEWIEAIYKQTGRIDVLVNNANYVAWGHVVELSVQEAERTMRVGYDGMVYAVKAVLPLMLAARRGHIVNMGSAAGRVFAGGAPAAYAAVKAAINAYTQMLQVELRRSPVGVTLVRPGAVAGTDFFGKHNALPYLPRLADLVPYTTPPQVAASVVRAIHDRRAIVDIPRFMPLFYLFFDLAPGLVRWLSSLGGPARRDYGHVAWRYADGPDRHS